MGRIGQRKKKKILPKGGHETRHFRHSVHGSCAVFYRFRQLEPDFEKQE
jgi:hypothetical protein